MKQKINAAFNNVNDAKLALGNIKRENLNQAHLKVLFLADFEESAHQAKSNFEFGEELFFQTPKNNHFDWPGVKGMTISGLGEIQVAISAPFNQGEEFVPDLSADELGLIEPEVKAHKIITIIEAEPELIPKLKLMLHANGAEII